MSFKNLLIGIVNGTIKKNEDSMFTVGLKEPAYYIFVF